MLLIGLIILLLGLGSLLLPCLRCVRASSTRAQKKLRVVVASQVKNIRVILSEKTKIVPMSVAFFRVQVLESFSVFIGVALRAPNLFSERKVASKSLNQKGHVGIGTTSPVQKLVVVGQVAASEGLPSGCGSQNGFSFYQDGCQDTGMFSNSDGDLRFYSNAVDTINVEGANVGIVFTCPFFRSSISAISRATKPLFQNFRTRANRHRNRVQGSGNPRASPFLVTV
jgi:hypothetical protein